MSTYLQTAREHEDIATPQEYYARVNPRRSVSIRGPSSSAAGRRAGTSATIPPRPSTVWSSECRSELAGAEDPLIEVIGGLGIRLHTYLPTRTFELAVHGLDIARAVGISFTLPDDVLDEATGWRRASPWQRARRDGAAGVDRRAGAAAVVLRCLGVHRLVGGRWLHGACSD